MTESLAMMPWFPRDFIAATRAMRLAERGAYRDLLDYQWEMGKLPSDEDRIARLLGCTREEFDDVWPAIADKFVRIGTYMLNQRLEEHRKRALEQRARKVKGARLTNAKRHAERPDSDTDGDTLTATLSDTLSGTPPSPSPSPETLGDSSSGFDTSSGALESRADDAERHAERGREGKASEARGTRLPDPFVLTAEMRAWAKVEAPNVDVKAATTEFVDYWRAIPGQRGRKLDWIATWRNRVREWQARAASKRASGSGNGAKTHAQVMAVLDALPPCDEPEFPEDARP